MELERALTQSSNVISFIYLPRENEVELERALTQSSNVISFIYLPRENEVELERALTQFPGIQSYEDLKIINFKKPPNCINASVTF
ncbi:MAG: hypothetical protein ACI4D3_09380 [Lachnospiraceae bacterium]